MKKISSLTAASVLALAFAFAGCAAAPNKISDKQIKKLQDKIDQLQAEIDAQQTDYNTAQNDPACHSDKDCAADEFCDFGVCRADPVPVDKSQLTMQNLAGTWKATSFVETLSSGKQVAHLKDPKDSLTLVIKSNGQLNWKSVDGWTGDTSDDIYQVAIASPTSLKITKSDTQTFTIAYSANSMTWKKYPWGSSTVDFTFERVGE